MKRLGRRNFIKISALMAVLISLLRFLPKPSPREIKVVRPPGAIVEEEFLKKCIRCGRCVEACSTNGTGTLELCTFSDGFNVVGTPKINAYKAPCEARFGRCEGVLPCVKACPTGALIWVEPHEIKLGSVEWLRERCIAFKGGHCLVCYEVCPVEEAIIVREVNIRKGRKLVTVRIPIFNSEACIGCGRCVNACPAIPKALVLTPKGARRPKPSS